MKLHFRVFEQLNGSIVPVAFCGINFFIDGIIRSSGLLFIHTQQAFTLNKKLAIFPFILPFALKNFCDFFVKISIESYGIGTYSALAGVICSIGAGACFWANNITAITFFWGIVFGIGYGIHKSVSLKTENTDFGSNLPTYNSVSICSYIGCILFSFLLKLLIDSYAYTGSYLLISGLILNSLPLAIAVLTFNDPKFPELFRRKGRKKSRSLEDVHCNDPDKTLQVTQANSDKKNQLSSSPLNETQDNLQDFFEKKYSFFSNGNSEIPISPEYDSGIENEKQRKIQNFANNVCEFKPKIEASSPVKITKDLDLKSVITEDTNTIIKPVSPCMPTINIVQESTEEKDSNIITSKNFENEVSKCEEVLEPKQQSLRVPEIQIKTCSLKNNVNVNVGSNNSINHSICKEIDLEEKKDRRSNSNEKTVIGCENGKAKKKPTHLKLLICNDQNLQKDGNNSVIGFQSFTNTQPVIEKPKVFTTDTSAHIQSEKRSKLNSVETNKQNIKTQTHDSNKESKNETNPVEISQTNSRSSTNYNSKLKKNKKVKTDSELKVQVIEYIITAEQESDWLDEIKKQSKKKNTYRRHANSVSRKYFENLNLNFTLDPAPHISEPSFSAKPNLDQPKVDNNTSNSRSPVRDFYYENKTKCCKSLTTLFKFLEYLVLIIIMAAYEFLFSCMLCIMADLSIEHGVFRNQAHWILFLYSVGCILGCMIFSKINCKNTRKQNFSLAIGFIGVAVSLTGILFSDTCIRFFITLCCFGFFESGLNIKLHVLIMKYSQCKDMKVVLSASNFISGLPILAIPFAIGAFKDTEESYDSILQILIATATLSISLCFALPKIRSDIS